MKKITSIILVLLSCITLTVSAQTTCDPRSPDKKPGRCAYFNDPDGDIALCAGHIVVGTYCGYGSITQQ
jgi:hypothetical protein